MVPFMKNNPRGEKPSQKGSYCTLSGFFPGRSKPSRHLFLSSPPPQPPIPPRVSPKRGNAFQFQPRKLAAQKKMVWKSWVKRKSKALQKTCIQSFNHLAKTKTKSFGDCSNATFLLYYQEYTCLQYLHLLDSKTFGPFLLSCLLFSSGAEVLVR